MDELDRVVQGLSRIADPQALLEGLFAFAPVGFQIFSVEGRSVVTNRAFRAIFGSEPPRTTASSRTRSPRLPGCSR